MIWIVAYFVAGALLVSLRAKSIFEAPPHSVAMKVTLCALNIAVWPLSLFYILQDHVQKRQAAAAATEPPFIVQRKDLGETLSVDDIEARERVEDPLGAVPDLPFGHLNPAWARFKADLRPTCRIATFSRVHGRWAQRRYEGYAEILAGEVEQWFVASIRNIER